MDINAQAVKQLRLERGWTQQHLADACDLSLRTIQRVEKIGNASNETLMGLSAVFEIEQQELLRVPQPKPDQMAEVTQYGKPLWLGLAATIGALVGAGVMYWLLSL